MENFTWNIKVKQHSIVFKEIYFVFVHKMPHILIAEPKLPSIHLKTYPLYDSLNGIFL